LVLGLQIVHGVFFVLDEINGLEAARIGRECGRGYGAGSRPLVEFEEN